MTGEMEILRGIRAYHLPGDVVELRIPERGKGATSAYFDDFDKLAEAAAKYSQIRRYPGIYITLNPVRPELLARANNRIRFTEDKTKDNEIVELRWLPIDIDAIRSSGISSCEEEHSKVIEKAAKVKAWLIARGWPKDAFILADSGNGAHLPVRIQLENIKEDIDLIKRCLEALDLVFSDEACKIDTTTYNPSRIWKLPGTWVCKGEDMPDRPYRLAKLIDAPGEAQIASKELLEDLARLAPTTDKRVQQTRNIHTNFDPVEWSESHGLKVRNIKQWNGWKLAILEQCPFDSSHNRGEAYVGSLPYGPIDFKCWHDSCKNKSWQDLKVLLETEKSQDWPESNSSKAGPKSNCKLDDGKEKKPFDQISERIPEWITEHHFKTVSDTERLYHYHQGVYRDDGEQILKAQIEKEFGDVTNDRLVADIIGKVKRRTYVDRDAFNSKNILNVKNGLLDLETLQIMPHTPDYLSTAQLDVLYDPASKAPKISKFLSEVAQSGDIALIEEIIGWLLWPDYNIHKAVMFLGPGRNGKGTLLRLMTAFLGKRSVSNVTLQDLVADRFAKADLYGKLANIGGDLPSKDLSDTAAFRNLTGGDDNRAQEKYRPAFNFRNKAKLMFSANVLPRSPDDTYAFYSRWILIEFLNIFDVQKGTGDPDLDAKLQTPEELSGLLNIAIEGLKRLRTNSWRFSYNKTVEDVEIMYKRNANSVLAFVMDECEAGDATDYIEKTLFYNRFKEYVKAHGIRPLSSTKFSELLKDQTEVPVSSARPWMDYGPRPMCWQGIRFKSHMGETVKRGEDENGSSKSQSRPSIVLPTPSSTEKGDENDKVDIGKVGFKQTLDGLDCACDEAPGFAAGLKRRHCLMCDRNFSFDLGIHYQDGYICANCSIYGASAKPPVPDPQMKFNCDEDSLGGNGEFQ